MHPHAQQSRAHPPALASPHRIAPSYWHGSRKSSSLATFLSSCSSIPQRDVIFFSLSSDDMFCRAVSLSNLTQRLPCLPEQLCTSQTRFLHPADGIPPSRRKQGPVETARLRGVPPWPYPQFSVDRMSAWWHQDLNICLETSLDPAPRLLCSAYRRTFKIPNRSTDGSRCCAGKGFDFPIAGGFSDSQGPMRL